MFAETLKKVLSLVTHVECVHVYIYKNIVDIYIYMYIVIYIYSWESMSAQLRPGLEQLLVLFAKGDHPINVCP